MKISEGVSLAWQLAAQETITAQTPLIDPVQFIIAIGWLHQLLHDGDSGINFATDVNVNAISGEMRRITEALSLFGIDLGRMSNELRTRAGKGDHRYKKGDKVHRSDSLKALFDQGLSIADQAKSDTLTLEHIFLAVLGNPNLLACQILKELNINPEDIARKIQESVKEKPVGGTPLLDEIGKDLTALAKAGRLGPVIGRRCEVL